MAQLFDRRVIASADEALQLILASSTEYSIIGEDLQGRVILWNEGAERLYGYTAAEAVGRLLTDDLHSAEGLRANRPREMRDVAATAGRWIGEVERRRKNGATFVAHAVFTPYRGSDGRIVAYLLVSRDLSSERNERQRQEEKFRSLLEAAPDAMVIVDNEGRIVLINSQTTCWASPWRS
jgi:PAS domain S-box-containing protein